MSNTLNTTFLLALVTALLLWMGQALGGSQGLVLALVVAAAMNLWIANPFSTHPPSDDRIRRLRAMAY